MIFPVAGREGVDYRITQGFSSAHKGIDIAPIPRGTRGVPCLAPENCVVARAGSNPALEGKYLILKGDSGNYYYFGHFDSQAVSVNQRVAEGAVIGIMGMTGKADGIHTHHEVRPRQAGPGTQIDPAEYYKKNVTGDGMEKADDNYIKRVFENQYLQEAGEADLKAWRGRTKLQLWEEMSSHLRRDLKRKEIAATYIQRDNLVKELASGGTVLPAGKYVVKG